MERPWRACFSSTCEPASTCSCARKQSCWQPAADRRCTGTTPSGDKSCDGLAMAWRAGLPLRDMEMVQFHPTGLLAGAHTRMTGTVLEEGLRGAGGHLLNGERERFMGRYDPKAERATRDIVSRAMLSEIRKGETSPHGGLYISMAHLGADNVRKQFKGMVERCADCGFDLAGGRVAVVPTAHYMMGGVEFAAGC